MYYFPNYAKDEERARQSSYNNSIENRKKSQCEFYNNIMVIIISLKLPQTTISKQSITNKLKHLMLQNLKDLYM